MKMFIIGTVFGLVLATVGFGGIAKILDHGVDKVKTMIQRALIAFYVDKEFGGSKLAEARSHAMSASADEMYKEAGRLRKEAQALLRPRRP